MNSSALLTHVRRCLAVGGLSLTLAAALVPTSSTASMSDTFSANNATQIRNGAELLALMGAPATTTADGPVWSAGATGMASIPTAESPDGTTGGLGGRTVTAGTAEELTGYAAQPGPLVIVVRGSLRIPF